MSDAAPDWADAEVEIERRVGRRHRVFLAGKGLLPGNRVVDLTFRDLSSGGARLILHDKAVIAGELSVLLLREGLVLRARVIWARPPMFGVAFRQAIDISAGGHPHHSPLVEVWRSWKASNPPAPG